jgi:unsaturated rhamnogalacturonyl hydrolase
MNINCTSKLSALLIACLVFQVAQAESPISKAGFRKAAIGVTRNSTEIPVYLAPGAETLDPAKPRVLIICGSDGSLNSRDFGQDLLIHLATNHAELCRELQLAIIPNLFPDGLKMNGETTYPPYKGYYDSADSPETRYLWRWAGMFGARVIFDVNAGRKNFGMDISDPAATLQFRQRLIDSGWAMTIQDQTGLIKHMSTKGVEDLGPVPTFSLAADLENVTSFIGMAKAWPRSDCQLELARREKRTPAEIARELVKVYGHDLKQVAYIPALAVIGRLRTAEQNQDAAEAKSLSQLLEAFRSGQSNPLPKSGSEHAGHLIFAEMAKRSEGKDRERWIELCRAAADQIFDKDGKPLKLMPSHNEMSDAVFMATPIICATGKLTGEQKYFDAAVTHFRSMKKLCLADDYLYRHSPLNEAAWGRGNGFPAMGLAWALSEFPEDHPDFPELKKDFQNHIAALLKHQDEFGCWHQVIDKPVSYREFSATCMIAWAIKRGLDRGWLDQKTHQRALDRAWIAAKQRIGPKGVVVDICTGTGKQKSLRDYYDRPAIWGVDARGGAMALMLATEMMDDK